MNESTPRTGTPGGSIPAPTFFDPAFERLPSAVAWDAEHAGPTLLLFDPLAEREWVADAAIALATAWARAGRRAVLADLSLDDPVLHERIAMENLDGVVDIFLYGASLARSARAVPGRGFYLISAGTYTPDTQLILEHPRWEKIVTGFREAHASLILFVPAGADGLAAVARWADEVIVLAGQDAAASLPGVIAPLNLPVRAWLAPPSRGGAAPVAHAPETPYFAPTSAPTEHFPEPAPLQPWNLPRGDDAPAVVTARPTPVEEAFRSAGETVGSSPAALPVPDPEWEAVPDARSRKRRVSPLLLVVLALVVVGGAAYLWAMRFPHLLPEGGRPAVGSTITGAADPGAAKVGPPQTPSGTPLPYAIHVAAFDALDPARREVEKDAQRFPEAAFYISPQERGGKLYYHVLSGALSDTSDANGLKKRLVDEKIADPDATGEWDLIQHRPLSFDLGEFTTRAAATARADSLARRGIPAHVLAVPFTDGSERWRLYGGAFPDSASAEAMRVILQAARVPSRLVERTGRPPASPK